MKCLSISPKSDKPWLLKKGSERNVTSKWALPETYHVFTNLCGCHTIYLLCVDGAVAHMSTRGKPEGVGCLLLCGFLRRCLGNTEGLLISFHAVTSLPVFSVHSLGLCLHGCEHMRLLSRYRRGTHATTAHCRG